ncbi:MAG: DNA primase [Nitrospina sp.]|nr:DNA primase [Nitrospina sp.]MBT6718520.1 DNA primase [Nitrospina sp.]
MNYSIPDSVIDEVRDRTDIVEVVSQHVALKKVGKNFKGLCPFHSEKTPSFTVSSEKRIYHCFGCGAGGNVFKFVMEIQSISFIDAVRQFAESAGVPLPKPNTGNLNDPAYKEREELKKANELAAKYFHSLFNDAEAGLAARDYLKGRHFTGEVLDKYNIGWAMPEWKGLTSHLQKTGNLSRKTVLQSGLVIEKEEGSKVYDRFRGRVIFPIKDNHGSVIGFGGRAIAEGDNPKYLNSPETPLYQKSQVLFGMDIAKQAIRKEDQAILVEGYLDQMRATQYGILNSVATCGTALTSKQAAMLRNYASSVVLVFDSDNAGRSAADKGFEVLHEKGIHVKTVFLPEGQDPDSYIQENGAEKFLEKIKTAKPYLESYIDTVVAGKNGSSPSERVEMANKVLPMVGKIQNLVERNGLLEYFSFKAKIDDASFLTELKKSFSRNQARVDIPETRTSSTLNLERHLVHLILSDKEIAQRVLEAVNPEDFSNPALKSIATTCMQKINEDEDLEIDKLIDETDDPEIRGRLTQFGLEPIEFDSPEKTISDCVAKFNNVHIKSKIKIVKQQRNEAEMAGQVEKSRELQNKLREMQLALTH